MGATMGYLEAYMYASISDNLADNHEMNRNHKRTVPDSALEAAAESAYIASISNELSDKTRDILIVDWRRARLAALKAAHAVTEECDEAVTSSSKPSSGATTAAAAASSTSLDEKGASNAAVARSSDARPSIVISDPSTYWKCRWCDDAEVAKGLDVIGRLRHQWRCPRRVFRCPYPECLKVRACFFSLLIEGCL
jgi:hypothetical protein